jgi:hypothetical protein
VGHDSNIASLLTALDFKPYQLHDQYERTPIGGKIVFQRWHDSGANRDLMKIEYVSKHGAAAQRRNLNPAIPAAAGDAGAERLSGGCQRLLPDGDV